MAVFHGAPVRIPRREDFNIDPSVSRIVKVILTGDTTLVADSDAFNVLWNDSADADTDLNIPLFLLKEGVMIENIGFQNAMVHTESAAFILGDTADSDGWLDTVTFVATATDVLGVVKWGSQAFSARTGTDTAGAGDYTWNPAYFQTGPRIVYADSAYSTVAVVGLDSGSEPTHDEYVIHVHQKGAVDVTGLTEIYLKYNMAGMMAPNAPSSNLGTTGD